jgi:hypothetical protein
MSDRINFHPLPPRVSVLEIRGPKSIEGGSQSDVFLLRIAKSVQKGQVIVSVRGPGLMSVLPRDAAYDGGIMADNSHAFATNQIGDVEVEIVSALVSGPFTVTVIFQSPVEPYNDYT